MKENLEVINDNKFINDISFLNLEDYKLKI
jgi:hypothetical protein